MLAATVLLAAVTAPALAWESDEDDGEGDCGYGQEDFGEQDYGTDDPGVGVDDKQTCQSSTDTQASEQASMSPGDGIDWDTETNDMEGGDASIDEADRRDISKAGTFQNSKLPGSSILGIYHASEAVDVPDQEERLEDDGQVQEEELGAADDDGDY
ncbi:hypothetical protein [Halobaculum sp. D14]|uniref:hypothetical protein n=1 Tax=Halobaculum sp. D14 TaxID=3421642 RepID=UPI003EB9107F